jgi:hypothetical protein
MKQLKVSLPDHLREWLDNASSASGKSVAEEIRERVIRSFEITVDPKTQDLINFIMRLAHQIGLETGCPWHEHPGVKEAFSTAVAARVGRLGAEGEPAAFEILTEPFLGKVIGRQVDRREYGHVLEWIDARTSTSLIDEKRRPQINNRTPTAEELLNPKEGESEKP